MNIGIVGTGRMAAQRAKAFGEHPDVSIRSVVSRTSDRAAKFMKEHQLSAVASTFEKLVDDDDIEGVIITGPNSVHYTQAVAALDAGKHVFLEYPVVVNESELVQLEKAVRRAAGCIHVGLTHRYGELHARLVSELSGHGRYNLGKPVAMQKSMCSGNPISRWYDDDQLSGGMFIASMYHHVDEAISLFGPVTDSWAAYRAVRDRSGKVQSDSATVSLVHAAGCVAQITYARGLTKPGIGSDMRIIATGGYFVDDASGARFLNAEGEHTVQAEEDFQPVDAMKEDSKAFCTLIESGRKSDGTFESACETLRLSLSLQAFATSGREHG